MKLAANVILLVIIGTACTEKPKINPTLNASEGVYIVNEGNYDWGEGTITYWNPKTGEVRDDVFKNANGRPLGNVAQSMIKIDDLGYVVVNNSQKIEAVDIQNFKSKFVISNMASPRYVLPVNKNKLYVSDLYADGVYVISDNKIIKKIYVSGWTNRMILDNKGMAWVARRRTDFDARPGGTTIVGIDTSLNEVVDSVNIGTGVEEIERDNEGAIWTACDNYRNQNYPALVKINNGNVQVVQTPSPILRLRCDGENIYFLMDNALYLMSVNESSLPENPLFRSSGRLYGLGIGKNHIFVSDAKDYVQRGTVFRLDKLGNLIDSVKVGIIPGEFCILD